MTGLPPTAARRPLSGHLARLPAELRPHRRAIVPLAALALAWAVWASGPGWATPAFAVVAISAAAHGVIDARTHRLPDAITFPAVAATTASLAVAAVGTGDGGRLGRALLAAVVLGGAYLVLHLVNRRGLGRGDVKLAVLLGLPAGWAGWDAVWWAGVLPFLLGGAAAVVLLVARRATLRSAIPLGPWMVLGTGISLSVSRLIA